MGDLFFGWPQLSYLLLTALGIGLVWARHGQPRSERYNVWYSLIGSVIVLPILYFGGFFTA